MRRVIGTVVCALLLTAACIVAAQLVIGSQPKADAQLHNPYWPFSVETSVKDR